VSIRLDSFDTKQAIKLVKTTSFTNSQGNFRYVQKQYWADFSWFFCFFGVARVIANRT